MKYSVLALSVLSALALNANATTINVTQDNQTFEASYTGSASDSELVFKQTASPDNFSKLIYITGSNKSLTISNYDSVSLVQAEGQEFKKANTSGALVVGAGAVFTLNGNGDTIFNIGTDSEKFKTNVTKTDGTIEGGQAIHAWSGNVYFKNLHSFYVNTDSEGVMVQHNTKLYEQSNLDIESKVVEINSVKSSVYAYTFDGGRSLLNIKANTVKLNTDEYGVGIYDTWEGTTGSGASQVSIAASDSINIYGGKLGVSIFRVANGTSSQIKLAAPKVNITAGNKVGYALQVEMSDTSNNQSNQIVIDGGTVNLSSARDSVYLVNGKASINADEIYINPENNKAVSLTNGAVLELTASAHGRTVINGNVNALDSDQKPILKGSATQIATTKSTIAVRNQDVILSEGSIFKADTLNSDGESSLVFNTDEKGGVTVNHLKGSIDLVAGSTLTEKYGSGTAVVSAVKDGIFASETEEGKAKLVESLAGGEASDLTAAWTYDPETGAVATLGDPSGLSPTLVAAKKTMGASLSQWRYEINHLSERLGDVRNLKGAVGTWARVYGAEAKLEDSVSTKVRGNTIQVGADARVGDNWIVGGAFGYTDSKADFSNGEASTDSYTFAVYGTAFFPCGGYVDLIARAGRMSTDVDVATVTDFESSYGNNTFGLSAEVGYRWDISKIFYLTPQAELSYGYVKGDDYTAQNEIRVDQDDFETLVGRLGFQAGVNVADGAGTVYLTASVNHDFQGESEATATRGDAAPQKLSEDLGGTWVSYGFGAQLNVKENWSFYGSLTRANGSDYQENYRYSVGTVYRW